MVHVFLPFNQEIFPLPNGRVEGPVIFEKIHCCGMWMYKKVHYDEGAKYCKVFY